MHIKTIYSCLTYSEIVRKDKYRRVSIIYWLYSHKTFYFIIAIKVLKACRIRNNKHHYVLKNKCLEDIKIHSLT